MIFQCPKSRFLVSFFACILLSVFLFYLAFFVLAGSEEELGWFYLLTIIVMMFLNILFFVYMGIVWYGYRLNIIKGIILKEWVFFGKVFWSRRIIELKKNTVILKGDFLALQDLSSSELFRSYCEFGPPYIGFSFNKSSVTFIQVSDFANFVKEVISRMDYVEMDESSKKAAESMGINLGNKIKVVELNN